MMNGFDPYSPEFQAWHKQLGMDAGYTSPNLLQPDNSVAQAARMADPNYGNMMQSSGAAPVSTPLWQFQDQLRQDPRYDKTTQAVNDAYSTVAQIGKDWGFGT